VTVRQFAPNRVTGRGEALLVAALARGATQDQAALEARVSRSTVTRRLREDAFRRQVSEARSELVSRAVGQLADASAEAATTLRELLSADADTVKLGAAKAILETGGRLREQGEIEERLAALEAAIDHNGRA
jgi:hypothetical protein